MKELVMIIRPEKLEDIKQILDDIHCGGMTLSTVMGCGTQKGLDTDAGFIRSLNVRRIFLVIHVRMPARRDVSALVQIISSDCGGRRRLHKLWHVCSVLFRTGNLNTGMDEVCIV